jgi:hypothetical protein
LRSTIPRWTSTAQDGFRAQSIDPHRPRDVLDALLDREQQYFADGITGDLTTDLSRIEGSFVISRNTAFTYKDKPIDTKQIGRELVCAMCWKEAFAGRVTESASTPS